MYYISSFLFIPNGSGVLITSLDEVCTAPQNDPDPVMIPNPEMIPKSTPK